MEYQLPDKQRGQEVVWFFGLRWHAVLEVNVKQQAQRLAKEMGALSWVLSGQTIRSVGLSSQKAQSRSKALHVAAAALFAAVYQEQSVAAIFKLPTGLFWFVAAQKGRVLVQGDHCFEAIEAAQNFMKTVLADHPQLGCLHTQEKYLNWSFLPAKALSNAFLKQAALKKRKSLLWGFSLSILVAVSILSVLINWAGKEESTENSLQPTDLFASKKIEKILNKHPKAVLGPVLKFYYQLPVHALGWKLKESDCQFSIQEEGWLCDAQYQRADKAAEIDYFLEYLNWQPYAQVASLNEVQIVFPSISIENKQWEAQTPVTLFQFLSQLQKMQIAFQQLNYSYQENKLNHWQNRSQIRLKGPLRSGTLPLDLPLHVHWYDAKLKFINHMKPDLKKSQFELTLLGAVNDQQVD